MIQRSDDGGETWEAVGKDFKYDGTPGTHQWYDGTQHPWEFKRVWHLERSIDPETVYAGVEDAALFLTSDGARTWQELPGLRSAKGNLSQSEPVECVCTRSSSIRTIPTESLLHLCGRPFRT